MNTGSESPDDDGPCAKTKAVRRISVTRTRASEVSEIFDAPNARARETSEAVQRVLYTRTTVELTTRGWNDGRNF
jgi:hypothetical protein